MVARGGEERFVPQRSPCCPVDEDDGAVAQLRLEGRAGHQVDRTAAIDRDLRAGKPVWLDTTAIDRFSRDAPAGDLHAQADQYTQAALQDRNADQD